MKEFISEFVTEISNELITSSIAQAVIQVGHNFNDEQMAEYMEGVRRVRPRRGPGSSAGI